MRKLLDVLNRLVDQGNTVIVIEHNLDVVKSADWIIDMGPEGGDRGGTVVAEGSPEQVAAVAASYTGQVLAPILGVLPGIAASPARSGDGTGAAKAVARKKSPATKAVRAKKEPAAGTRSTARQATKKSAATKQATKKSVTKATATKATAAKKAPGGGRPLPRGDGSAA